MDFVIAVDGPAASGKGTVAARLAELFALPYLDTGLLYRAVGVLAAETGGALETAATACARTVQSYSLADPRLRSRAAGELASQVAAFPPVRQALLDYQLRFAERPGGAVLDGRDIGTVIAPSAAAKLFVTAAAEVRAERRWRQLAGQGDPATLEGVLADIRTRDARDSGRSAAPLAQAFDAILLDTSELTIPQSVEAARRIVQAARSRWDLSRFG